MNQEMQLLVRLLRFSRRKIAIFTLLFLMATLTPIIRVEQLGGSLQPALIFLLFFLSRIDDIAHSAVLSGLLYAITYIVGLFLIYLVACLLGEGTGYILDIFKKKKGGRGV